MFQKRLLQALFVNCDKSFRSMVILFPQNQPLNHRQKFKKVGLVGANML